MRRAQSGDADAIETLLRRSAPILGRAMRSLHLPGEEPADTLAFHRRSFLVALRDYRPERGASWPRFLHMVLVRKVVATLWCIVKGRDRCRARTLFPTVRRQVKEWLDSNLKDIVASKEE